jgi:acetyl-CoA/propionyl-CoA carboxylase biotin carboxyl carrier protein
LIVAAPDRATAIARMRRALGELVVVGIATNQAFHNRLFEDDAFCRGDIDIQFLERRPDLVDPAPDPGRDFSLAVAAALMEDEARRGLRLAVSPSEDTGTQWRQMARRDALR